MNVGSLLTNSASKHPHATAIVSGEKRLSFSELEDRSGRLAGAMKAAGLERGDSIGILFYNSDAFVETYFAAMRIGLAATPVNFRFTGKEIAYVMNDSRPKALFYGPEFEETILKIRDELESVRLFASPHRGESSLAVDYETFLSGGKWTPCSGEVGEDNVCQIMYTSGTTGRPKGAVITHRNVIWNLFNTMFGREDRPGQTSIIVGPLYHTAALNNHLAIQISLGGVSILVKKFDPESMLSIIEKEKATLISGSPAMYNMLMQHPSASRYDRSSITKCTAGADKLLMETKRELMEFFPNIRGVYDVYGCTEASPSITIMNAADSLRKDGSVGKALPFLDARVVGEEDQPLATGEVGELVCKGPNVMRGYHGNPEATRETIRDGWLHTGDLARIDEEGFFSIVDRKKDMIVSGGENIYPREVEEVLYAHPGIADAAVVGIPDPLWGENVKAFVVLKPGYEGNEAMVAELQEHVKNSIAPYKYPRAVEFLTALPRTETGKLQRFKLRPRS